MSLIKNVEKTSITIQLFVTRKPTIFRSCNKQQSIFLRIVVDFHRNHAISSCKIRKFIFYFSIQRKTLRPNRQLKDLQNSFFHFYDQAQTRQQNINWTRGWISTTIILLSCKLCVNRYHKCITFTFLLPVAFGEYHTVRFSDIGNENLWQKQRFSCFQISWQKKKNSHLRQ